MFEQYYKEPALEVLQDSSAVWSLLWRLRHLFNPKKSVPPLCQADERQDGLRGAVVLVLIQVLSLYIRINGYVVLFTKKYLKIDLNNVPTGWGYLLCLWAWPKSSSIAGNSTNKSG